MMRLKNEGGNDMKPEQVYAALDSLLDYAKNCELLHPLDETFARNSLLAELKLESYEKQKEHYEISGMSECSVRLCSRERTDQRHHCGARPV